MMSAKVFINAMPQLLSTQGTLLFHLVFYGMVHDHALSVVALSTASMSVMLVLGYVQAVSMSLQSSVVG
jgi:hypothetical protein